MRAALHGWWLEHPSPRGQVIYWHGNGGNLSLWMPVLTDLRQRRFSVLAVDYRGYGTSTGRPSERGIYGDADAATTYFNDRLRKAGTPVLFWGRSLGCAVASHAADSIIPFAAGRRVFELAPTARKTFAALPGADHNDPHASHPAYWPALERFIANLY